MPRLSFSDAIQRLAWVRTAKPKSPRRSERLFILGALDKGSFNMLKYFEKSKTKPHVFADIQLKAEGRCRGLEDTEIIALYQNRDEDAIRQTEKKYSGYLTKIALNILGSREDSEECVNDTYFKAWNTIPPNVPAALSHYLGKITRELSIDRLRRKTSQKRGGSEYELSLEELRECAAPDNTEQAADLSALVALIGKFLRSCRDSERDMFVCRYFFCDSLKEIAGYFGDSEAKIKSTLFRLRKKIKKYLESEGYVI